jgi:very-short-patch-repair endonuclease
MNVQMLKQVENALDDLGIEYVREAQIENFRADFLLSEFNIVIEVDGSAHKYYRQIARDNIKNQFYKSQGYSYLRLTQGAIEDKTHLRKRILTKVCQKTGRSFQEEVKKCQKVN